MGDKEWGITGMIDQLFYNEKSQKLEIWDWKTNKAIKENNKWQQFKEPLSHLDVCELNTYSLQLSFYKLIVERNTELDFRKQSPRRSNLGGIKDQKRSTGNHQYSILYSLDILHIWTYTNTKKIMQKS